MNIGVTSCNLSGGGDKWSNLVNETKQEVKLNGNTLTYGDHVYVMNGEIDHESTVHNVPTAYVTFTHVPSGYTEFEAVYNNFLGKSEQGAAAMIPMALEIYARDKSTGKRCLGLLCSNAAAVNEITRTLDQKLVPSKYAPEGDQYIQRYLPAALLKGAVNSNAYTPVEPYTVEMCSHVTPTQESTMSGGYVSSLYILAKGWDTEQRAVQILQPYNSEYYKVHGCPAAYSQCKVMQGEWQGLK